MGVSEADASTDIDIGDVTTNLSHDTDTLVAKNLAGAEEVLVCTAETGVCGLNVDLIGLQGAGGLVGNDLSLLGPTENFECDAHCVVNMQNQRCAQCRKEEIDGGVFCE